MIEKQICWPGWETVRLIGRGSFGSVYEIQREILGEVESAALKVISIPQNASDIEDLYADGYDEESITTTFHNHLKSIVAEYTLMRKMNGCTNVVNCDDVRFVQHDDGIGWTIYIKMELLEPLVKAVSMDVAEDTVIKVAKDLCTALELCKKHGIIHRDIKPQNIFVSQNGDFKLGDFGIAKTVEKTMGGTKIGTYKYMAPEVYKNLPYGSSADIYSVGLVLYWLLNERRLPFLPLPPARLSAGLDEMARNRRLSGEKLPAPAYGSEELKRIVLKACAYDVNDRYKSALEMLQDLDLLGKAEYTKESAAEMPDEPVHHTYIDSAVYDDEKTIGLFAHKTEQRRPNKSIPENDSETTERTEVLSAARRAEDRKPVHEQDYILCNVVVGQENKPGKKIWIAIGAAIMAVVAGITMFLSFAGVDYAEKANSLLFSQTSVRCIYREDPCETSREIADILKTVWDVEAFDEIVIVGGKGVSAAFNSSYFALTKKAPVLLIDENDLGGTVKYISNNLKSGGTIYFLGSTHNVREELLQNLPMLHECVLLYGDNRYETNATILKEAGIEGEQLLVCNDDSSIVSIAASATGLPVLLVGKDLKDSQISLLSESHCEIILLGGIESINESLENELEEFDQDIERMEAENEFEMSLQIAERFFENPEAIVLSSDEGYTQTLCAAVLANTMNAPIVFTIHQNGSMEDTVLRNIMRFVKDRSINNCLVLDDRDIKGQSIMNLLGAFSEEVSQTIAADPCATGHDWVEKTYFAPQTCSVCGLTEGRSLGYPLVLCEQISNTNRSDSTTDVAEGNWKDIHGKIHEDSIKFWVADFGSWENEESAVYKLDGQFDVLEISLILGEESQSGAETIINIWVDGSLVYQSEPITKEYGVIQESIDIQGAETIRITCSTSSPVFCHCIVASALFLE